MLSERPKSEVMNRFNQVLADYSTLKPAGIALRRFNSFTAMAHATAATVTDAGDVPAIEKQFLLKVLHAAYVQYQQCFTGSRLAKSILNFVGAELNIPRATTKSVFAAMFVSQEIVSKESDSVYFERLHETFFPATNAEKKQSLAHGITVSQTTQGEARMAAAEKERIATRQAFTWHRHM